MAPTVVQCNYEQMEAVAKRFQAQAEQTEQVLQQVRGRAEDLRSGGWVGKGSDAFQAELEHVVLPALQRMIEALQEASAVTMEIRETFRQAEEEAAGLFRGTHASETPGSTSGQDWWKRWGETVHDMLDVAGFYPGWGVIPDLANALIYAVEGRYAEAGLSSVAAVPIFGDAAKLSKMGTKASMRLGKEAVEEGAGRVVKEAAKKGSKRVAKGWEKFDRQLDNDFKQRLREFRGDDNIQVDKGMRGGEGQVFVSDKHPDLAIKRWFKDSMGKMDKSVDRLIKAREKVLNNPRLSADMDVVQVHRRKDDWIEREYDPDSIPLKKAIEDNNRLAANARDRLIRELEGTDDGIMKGLLSKLKGDSNPEKVSGPSSNLHWSFKKKKVLVIDML